MASEMSIQDRLSLITRGIPPLNVHGINAIRTALETPGRTPKCLWVTSPTGKPHVGYYVPLLKFADLIKAGCEIIVVLLDVYSFLDNVKYPMDQVRQRMFYYRYVVIGALKSLGIPTTNIRFVEESSYHFSREWIVDQWRLCTLVPQQAVKDAWDRSYNPDLLSPMFCPGIQTLAEEHLDVDFQFGGEDQQGIFSFAERFLPQLGYRIRGHIMNPMIPNLHGTKMSSSHPGKTKIMFLDDHQSVEHKVKEAPWNGLDSSKTGVLSVLKNVLIPAAELRQENRDRAGKLNGHTNGHTNGLTNGYASGDTNGVNSFNLNGHVNGNTNGTNDEGIAHIYGSKASADSLFTVEKSGSVLHFNTYDDVEKAVTDGAIGPDDIKAAVARGLNDLLDPVRQMYKDTPEWQALDPLAYPDDIQK